MKEIIEFIENKSLDTSSYLKKLKCSKDAIKILQYITKEYVLGRNSLLVLDVLSEFYDILKYKHLEKIKEIKILLELGWLVQNTFEDLVLNEIANIELLNIHISLSSSFFKILEANSKKHIHTEIKQYEDHLEYLQDQFSKIDLTQELNQVKKNFQKNSPNINNIESKLVLLENKIQNRVKVTNSKIVLENFFKTNNLEKEEKILFLALLKEEYGRSDNSIRDMNSLIDLISSNDYEKIKNRSFLDDDSKLISKTLIDYDEMLMPFGGINKTFFIPDDVLSNIAHPNKQNKTRKKVKLETLLKEQEIFELIDGNKSLDDVVLNETTRETINTLLKQVDKSVIDKLKLWGIKDKKKGIDAKIIFYGSSGTGKTLTSLAIAKVLKKQVLSFDCSKILSMYIGESEKNVRNIFDTFNNLTQRSKTQPILLLNEADQFLSTRTSNVASSGDKMHNQMQNIFLEQIERFDGILIATTNMIDSLDKAFSRRFNYKIEFKKPNLKQKKELWLKLLPSNFPLCDKFDVNTLAKYDLTGGQIELVIKNTAYNLAILDKPLFTNEAFEKHIKKELKGNFDSENIMGFL